MTTDRVLLEKWKRHVERRVASTQIKLKEAPRVVEVAPGGDTFEFSGILFDFDGWRTIDRERVLDPGKSMLTYREISALLGESLWDLRVRRLRPLEYADLLSVYQTVTPRTIKDWDMPATTTSEQRAALNKWVGAARQHQRCERLEPWVPGRYELYAVDACLQEAQRDRNIVGRSQAAIVHLAREARRVLSWRKWNHERTYIGEAELEAIVGAVEHAMGSGGTPPSLIIVATDSLVAKGWVEREYSERPGAQDLLTRLRELLKTTRLACPYVRSADNIADAPSRTDEPSDAPGVILAEQLDKTWSTLRTEVPSILHDAVVSGQVTVRRARDTTRPTPDG
jgi:hypothetical protein